MKRFSLVAGAALLVMGASTLAKQDEKPRRYTLFVTGAR
jgi:hypothetical protein